MDNGTTPSNKELIELVTIPQIYESGKLPQKLIDNYEEVDNTNPRPNDKNYVDFYNKKHTLFITPYVARGVILKYPLNEDTTVEEVDSYFVNFVKSLAFNKENSGFKIKR